MSTREGYTMGFSKATTSSHESRTVHSDAVFLLPYIKTDAQILDVGCGPGSITIGFADLVPYGRVTGVDYSEEILERARALAASKGLGSDRVDFKQASVLEKMAFEDNSFDIIYASQLFVHLSPPDDPIVALKELRRILKLGGILASRDGAVMQFYPYTAELDRLWVKNWYRGAGVPDFCGPHMRSWLRQAGFDVDNAEKAKIGGGATVYANKESCAWWYTSLAGRLKKGDKFRESWLKVGISEKECDESIEVLKKWSEHEDAWYGLLQSEVLVWK